mmetsp:Transcript_17388/g.16589  ORF Transcript_17388/g.16589 Transcript_17388/m.16589 type:complete len:110 (+) Transcript_17388:1381-1710(+)
MDSSRNETALTRIIGISNISFTFDFIDEKFINQLNAQMSITLLIENLNSEMSGENMWHFVYVLKAILFCRGERAARDLLIEKLRMKEMHSVKLDYIRNLLEQKLKKLFA